MKDYFERELNDIEDSIGLKMFLEGTDFYQVRWHMGFTDLATDSPFQKYAYNNAVEQCPLVSMLQIADMEATMLVEREVK